jgi:carbon-monoxide dehydrogenase medium subunit
VVCAAHVAAADRGEELADEKAETLVKPAGFDYYAPDSVDEAVRILADSGRDGRVLAGGQSLMPMLNCRIVNPAVLVDINRINGLDRVEANDTTLTLGALVRHAELLRNPQIRAGWPLLSEATAYVAHQAIRNRGTVCGSVAHNDPAAEQPSLLVTLGGTVVIAGVDGRRELPAEDFLTGMMSNALEPGEMVVAVRYPRPAAGTNSAFVEFARRRGDFALAGAAVTLTMHKGVCEQARVTTVGMGDGPFRARDAEAVLTGRALDPRTSKDAFAEAVARVAAAVEPSEDVHASADYRRHLAGIMTARALQMAFERGGGP